MEKFRFALRSTDVVDSKEKGAVIGISTELERPIQVLADFNVEWIESLNDLTKMNMKNNILQRLKGILNYLNHIVLM